MSSYELVRALRNERIIRKRLFTEMGMIPGPEPVIELLPTMVFIDRKDAKFFITLEDLIKVVEDLLQPA